MEIEMTTEIKYNPVTFDTKVQVVELVNGQWEGMYRDITTTLEWHHVGDKLICAITTQLPPEGKRYAVRHDGYMLIDFSIEGMLKANKLLELDANNTEDTSILLEWINDLIIKPNSAQSELIFWWLSDLGCFKNNRVHDGPTPRTKTIVLSRTT